MFTLYLTYILKLFHYHENQTLFLFYFFHQIAEVSTSVLIVLSIMCITLINISNLHTSSHKSYYYMDFLLSSLNNYDKKN